MLNDAWHALNECRAQARFCLFAYDNSDLRARYLQDPRFAGEAALNPLEFLDLTPNFYDGDARDVILGKKLIVFSFGRSKFNARCVFKSTLQAGFNFAHYKQSTLLNLLA